MTRLARTPILLLACLAPLACTEGGEDTLLAPVDDVAAARVDAPGLTVMSRNLYLGADIDIVLGGSDPSAALLLALQQLQQTDFGTRVFALAAEILAERPHLVGLQEVSRFEIPAGLGFPTEIDYLTALVGVVNAMGGDYVVAVYQPNLDLTLPLVLGGAPVGNIRYVDGDAILARSDVVLADPAAGHFDSQVTLAVGPFTFPNLRGWNAVTATAAGQTVRFVNTHLEIQRFEPYQVAQAHEMVALFEDETLPVVMVGDFNSAAEPNPLDGQSTASYRVLRNAGYADLWLREPHSNGGLTCCHAAALDNLEPELHARLDLVLARYGPAGYGGRSEMDIVGEEIGDRIDVAPGYTLWPSDHAGVVATIWPAPGLLAKPTP